MPKVLEQHLEPDITGADDEALQHQTGKEVVAEAKSGDHVRPGCWPMDLCFSLVPFF